MKKTIYIIAGIIFFYSCTERIDIELDTTYTRLVVEGHITDDSISQWVRLTKSTDYFGTTSSPPVSNATVTINDGTSDFKLLENESDPGLYEAPTGFIGILGNTYDLEINLQEEINGFDNYSSNCELRPVGPIDSIQVVYNPDWEGWEVKIYAWEPPSVDFYKFLVYKNDTLITDTITKVWISDDRYFNGNYTFGISVGFLDEDIPREVVRPGDIVTLEMAGITKEYYNFISQLQDQTFEYRNPLFSGPPANVETNITNDASGFFAAYSTTRSSTVYIE